MGRGRLHPVKLNEPLLSGQLALKEAGGGLPIIIPAGKRAMSVKVDQVIGVAGFTLPGTRVDILVTLDQVAGIPDAITQIVLQNIIVLTAGQVIERDTDGEPITVPVVTPVGDQHRGLPRPGACGGERKAAAGRLLGRQQTKFEDLRT